MASTTREFSLWLTGTRRLSGLGGSYLKNRLGGGGEAEDIWRQSLLFDWRRILLSIKESLEVSSRLCFGRWTSTLRSGFVRLLSPFSFIFVISKPFTPNLTQIFLSCSLSRIYQSSLPLIFAFIQVFSPSLNKAWLISDQIDDVADNEVFWEGCAEGITAPRDSITRITAGAGFPFEIYVVRLFILANNFTRVNSAMPC